MEVTATAAPELSLEERTFQEEIAAKKRELDLREREVRAKEEELRRSRWLNPLVIGLFAAALGLIGSVVVARVNNQASQQLEQFRSQSNLILQAIKTGDQDGACRNLLFFVDLGLLDNRDHTISNTCSGAPKGAPSLPVDSRTGASEKIPTSTVTVRVLGATGEQVQNLRVYYQLTGLAGMNVGIFPFAKLGSPTTQVLAPKNYVIWAAKDGDPNHPVSQKFLAHIEGDQPNIQVDLVIR
jgi:hypothetical protein